MLNYLKNFSTKWPLYSRVLWGLIVVFTFTGFLLGKSSNAVILTILVSVAWVVNRIVAETFEAIHALSVIRKVERSKQDGEEEG